ncbi:CBASS cGAMP-activated phospholipase [Cupriavidus taiwanensis]|uniref:CBASS cGAMP-activated phospholipase n=1 Tax=Cupriavidus taiwanensis TaxID=164546 RepID=UPI001F11D845|nr:CBASS cGAMP-activated phospholipase [Cupriavidus taiwanensis]
MDAHGTRSDCIGTRPRRGFAAVRCQFIRQQGESLDESAPDRFQILALSGGGFRGLYTARLLADFEEEIGAPIATRFDLIAGTSIGGVIALALALELPASRIVDLLTRHGEQIFQRRWSLAGIWRAPFGSRRLLELLCAEHLFGERLLGACAHRVVIPAINYSTGRPQIFKTPHHVNFKRDYKFRIADIAMATSAAPGYFARYTFNHNQFVDGGLYANAPGLLAVHEAQYSLLRSPADVHVMAIGTMSSKFTVNPRRNREGGTYDWGGINPANMPRRLFGLSISVQEALSDFMLSHLLPGRYVLVDDDLTDQRARAVGMDRADHAAREVLLGAASERSKICIGSREFQPFLRHLAPAPTFFYGENENAGVFARRGIGATAQVHRIAPAR